MMGSDYPGEPYLSEPLPNYGTERILLVIQLVMAFVFWVILVPLWTSQEVVVNNANHDPQQQAATASTATTTTTTSKSSSKATSSKSKKGKTVKSKQQQQQQKSSSPPTTSPPPSETIREMNPFVSAFATLAFMCTIVWILLKASPDNRYTARGVFEAPLFSRDECDFLVDMAEQVAERNYKLAETEQAASAVIASNNDDGDAASNSLNDTFQGFLKEPLGWQKRRHKSYPTTDLNVMTDPFTKSDRAWIRQKLDARLVPTISRLFGIPQGAIRAEDIFVVRYDGDRQASLNRHTDSGDITFSVLLSDGFEGGGTRYWNRHVKKPFVYLLPEIGQTTLFPAVINHEGVQVDEGRRYLLIGFLSVDKIDPFTMEPTGMSWFASWGSMNWASVRFKAGYESARRNMGQKVDKWTNQKYVRGLFVKLYEMMTKFGDEVMPHFFTKIVQTNQTNEFFKALDDAYAAGKRPKREANWFKGQLIDIDIDGTVNALQPNRKNNADLFEEDKI